MKVLHLLQSNRFSGAENVVCQIIGLMKDEPNIEMVYCSSDGQIREALDERNIRFIPLHNFSISEIRMVLKNESPDIIHAHDISASVLAAIAAFGKKSKLISHVHVNNSNMSKINFKTIVYALSAIRYHHIFWVSRSCYEGFVFRRAVMKKSSLLQNVMDKASILEKKDVDKKYYDYEVSYIGRLTDQKDPLRLVNVLGKLIALRPETKIAIVGTGDMEDCTKTLVQERNLERNIIFVGFMNNPLKLLESTQVMIMTSKYEGLPMTVLEAMALGVPIVSTPVDGLKDVILQGINGYLEDNDDALAGRMFDILSIPNLRKTLSESAENRFDELNDLSAYKREIQLVYEER